MLGLSFSGRGGGARLLLLAAVAMAALAAAAPLAQAAAGPEWLQLKRDSEHAGLLPNTVTYGGAPQVLATAAVGGAVRSTPIVADLDLDGEAEVVVANDLDGNGLQMWVRAYNVKSGALALKWEYLMPPGPYAYNYGFTRLAAGDMGEDATGDLEVVAYGMYAEKVDFSTPGLVFASWTVPQTALVVLKGDTGSVQAANSPSFPYIVHPVVADTDGNGKNEAIVLCCGSSGSVQSWELSTAGNSLNLKYSQFVNTFLTGLSAAEMDPGNAGKELLITKGRFASPQFYYCKPSATAANCGGYWGIANYGIWGVAAGDLNNDGQSEAVVGLETWEGSTVSNPTLNIMRFAGGGYVGATGQFLGELWNSPALGDVNGDGSSDIVAVQYANDPENQDHPGHVYARGYSGTTMTTLGTWQRPVTSGSPLPDSPGGPVLMNMQGDARPEVIFGTQNGHLVVGQFSPAGVPGPLWDVTIDATSAILAPPALGDTDADCRPDIVVAMQNGNLVVLSDDAPVTVPGPPQNLAAAISATGGPPPTGVQVVLTWEPPLTDGGAGVTGYRIYRGLAPNPATLLASVPSTTLAYTDTAVDDATTYYYRVTAENCLGEGPSTPDVTATTPDITPPEKVLDLVAVATSTSKIQLTWTKGVDNVDVTAYQLYWSPTTVVDLGSQMISLPATATSTVHAGLPVDTFHYYRIRAGDAAGYWGPLSDVLDIEGFPSVKVTAAAKTWNNPPIAGTSKLSTWPGIPVEVDLAQLVTEPDGQTVAFAVTKPPFGGELSGVPPQLSYLADPGFCFFDEFWYKVAEPPHVQFDPFSVPFPGWKDTALQSPEAYVFITNCVPNLGPVANDQLVKTVAGAAVAFTLEGWDPQAGPKDLVWTFVTEPAYGLVTGTPPNLQYARNEGCGKDQFTWRIFDGLAYAEATTVVKTLCGGNEVPEAHGQVVTAYVGEPLPIVLAGFDEEMGPLTFALVTSPKLGTWTLATPTVTFTGTAIGTTSFDFVADDGQKVSPPATVAIKVIDRGAQPQGNADTDRDGVFDLADNCPGVGNWEQSDQDGDEAGDPCDRRGLPGTGPPSEEEAGAAPADTDSDGVADLSDNCVRTANADQADLDADRLGDVCDTDRDGDGVRNSLDNCVTVPNPAQVDRDGDLLGDWCDVEVWAQDPASAAKVAPPNPAGEAPRRSSMGLVSWAVAAVGFLLLGAAAVLAFLLLRRTR